MGTTIISNNCIGAAIYQQMGARYESPTINLEVLPWEFPFFCRYLSHFMSSELKPVERMSRENINMLIRHYMYVPSMPYGTVDGILVCFNHYKDFKSAKYKWDERKERIDYEHIGCVFYVQDIARKSIAEYFTKEFLDVPNPVVLTEGFSIDSVSMETHRVDVPRGRSFIGFDGNKRVFEQDFSIREYWDKINSNTLPVKRFLGSSRPSERR